MAAFFNPNNIPKIELLRFTGSFVLSVRRPLPRPMQGNPDSGIREICARGIYNPGIWNPVYS